MIRFRNRSALYGECWFDEVPRALDCDVDILAFRQRSAPMTGAHCSPFLTIVNDLTLSSDALFATFGADCRQKLGRARRSDCLTFDLPTDPRVRLGEFCRFYDAFAKRKSLRRVDREWLRGACDAGQLALAVVYRCGEPVVWHGYVLAGSTAWLQYSASHHRGLDGTERCVIARADRWLHWQGMLAFKAMGFARYDWGGLLEDEPVAGGAGINRFTKEFGGRPARTFDCVVPRTMRGRLRLGLHGAANGCRFVRDFAKDIVAPPRRPVVEAPETRPE